MNSEEKILEILSKMQTQMGQMQTQMGQMQTQQEQMQKQMGQMQTQQEQMQKQLDRVESRVDRIEARQDQAQDDIQRIRLYLELDVEKRFEAINEGIDMIQAKLIPGERIEKRIEKTEDDIVVLKTAVKGLVYDVAKLKKAE